MELLVQKIVNVPKCCLFLLQKPGDITAKDLSDALRYIVKSPTSYYGAEWQITFLYAKWVLSGAP